MTSRSPRRQLLVLVVMLPVVVVAAVLAFAWPAGRIAPRNLPVGIVGTSPAAQAAVSGLDQTQPGAFDFRLYADDASARTAIRDREVFGAFEVGPTGVTVLEASAASSTVAQLLSGVGEQLAARATQQAASGGHPTEITAIIADVVPISPDDPHGVVLSSALLPLTICSILIASAIAVVVGFRPAWRQIGALIAVSAVAAVGVYLVAQAFLGAMPHEHLATWGAIGLTVLAISATTAGLFALFRHAGLAVSAVLMVFVGNPFSGVTSAPELLPDAVHRIGQWLPPGAGANLLRSTAYFGGHDYAGHLSTLVLWIVFGLGATVIGQHTSIRLSGRTGSRDPDTGATTVPPADVGSDAPTLVADTTGSRRLLVLPARRRAGTTEQRPGAHEAG